jgi:putative phosphoribosyl transferase
MWRAPEFIDRADAGQQLADAIANNGASENPIVLALPRGGVPVAYEIASRINAPLDLLFAQKIGAPGYPEYGIGAVVGIQHPQTVLNDDMLRSSGATSDYIDRETARQLLEIDRRRKLYLGNREPLELSGRNIIFVDDGIATGGTVRAGLKALRDAAVKSIMLAVPVAPCELIDALRSDVDRLVCLHAPADFRAVSIHYEKFPQVRDDEVVKLLADIGRNET